MNNQSWSLGMGATVKGKGVRFKVWAPSKKAVDVIFEKTGKTFPLRRFRQGYFEGKIRGIGHGELYRYRLDGKESFPDPCSRFQPQGPHGPSMVVDSEAFRWSDQSWRGVELQGQVIYEMHIGTFTREGTFDAAVRQLPELKRAGIRLLEIMPIADWAGRWNWGYDGVNYYAPSRCYGDENAFKRFVNRAHKLGLGVILDVVYNHFGPDGNYLNQFSSEYISKKHHSEWGASPNFDGAHSKEVRHFFLQNAAYWVSEFHLDGLRVDATQSIEDDSQDHFLGEITRIARQTAKPRNIVIIGENEPQDVKLLEPLDRGGYGFDALWSDDFHHVSRVSLTGFHEAYFTDYRGTAAELSACVKRGFLYQGQYYSWQKQSRGTVTRGFPAKAFVFYLQNHDQTANHSTAQRLSQISCPARYRALTALMLLGPSTPMIFMGQEFGSTRLFPYFSDHHKELAPAVDRGRQKFLNQFPSFRKPEMRKKVPPANAEKTFLSAKLDFSERKKNRKIYHFHRDLLNLRTKDPALKKQDWNEIESAVIFGQVLILRFLDKNPEKERLLLVNLGATLNYDPISEPLLALPRGWSWKLIFSSESSHYTEKKPKRNKFKFWDIPAETTLFFTVKRGRMVQR